MRTTHRTPHVLAALAAFLLTPGTARAQDAWAAPPAQGGTQSTRYVDRAHGMSVDDLVAHALDKGPAIAAARTDIETARGEWRQAGLRPNPTASADRQDELRGTDNRTAVNVEVPLDLFRRSGRVAAAARAVDVASLTVADRERVIASAVREQAGRALAELRNLEVTEEVLAAASRSRDLLRARVAEGATPELEFQMAELEVLRIEAERALLAGRVEEAFVMLKAAAGMEPDVPLVLRDRLEDLVLAARAEPPGGPAGGASSGPLALDRPDVRAARARVDLSDALIDQKRRDARFDVALYGGYMRMDAGFPQRGFDSDGSVARVRGVFHDVTFGATVSVPLWNRNQGAIAAAQSMRSGAALTHAALALEARAEIAAATAGERAAASAVAVFVSGARALAKRNLDVVREAYELGRTRLSDVLIEQRRLLETEMAFTGALSAAYQARVALRRAQGDVR